MESFCVTIFFKKGGGLFEEEYEAANTMRYIICYVEWRCHVYNISFICREWL